jgi:hypothetical protein
LVRLVMLFSTLISNRLHWVETTTFYLLSSGRGGA